MNQPYSHTFDSSILTQRDGLEVELLNYGATPKSIRVPAGDGYVNVLLTYPDNRDYLGDTAYLGATVGRYAGRIDSGIASLQGRQIQLVQNEPDTGHSLHGGGRGLQSKILVGEPAGQ